MIKNNVRLLLFLLSFSVAASDLKTSAEEALMNGDMELALENGAEDVTTDEPDLEEVFLEMTGGTA